MFTFQGCRVQVRLIIVFTIDWWMFLRCKVAWRWNRIQARRRQCSCKSSSSFNEMYLTKPFKVFEHPCGIRATETEGWRSKRQRKRQRSHLYAGERSSYYIGSDLELNVVNDQASHHPRLAQLTWASQQFAAFYWIMLWGSAENLSTSTSMLGR